jgi:hypothetical protein
VRSGFSLSLLLLLLLLLYRDEQLARPLGNNLITVRQSWGIAIEDEEKNVAYRV